MSVQVKPPAPAPLPPLHIRIQGTSEYVLVPPEKFPENPIDLNYLLQVESAPRSAWLHAATTYLRLNKLPHCISVLETAVSDAVDAMFAQESLTRLDLLAALAGAHVMRASQETDPEQREKCLRAAADVFSRADTLDVDYPSIWAARGWADFFAGKSVTATWFDHAMDNGLVLGAIGLAAVYLNKPAKSDPRKDPVSLLASALRANICPPGVWTGLGYALYKEGRIPAARDVVHRAIRALANSPPAERREAFYLLALIESCARNEDSPEMMAIALGEAFTLGGTRDTRMLSLSAHLHFCGGEFETAEKLAKRAVDVSDELPGASVGAMFAGLQTSAKAEALFQLARAQHHLGKVDEAIFALESIKKLLDSDSGSLKVNPGMLLRLGLLKIASERREDEPVAQECLERVLKVSNDRCGVAKRALGVLLGRKILLGLKRGRPRGGESFDRAVTLLRKGLDDGVHGKNDVPAQLVFAALVEEFQPKKALAAYRQAVATLQERKERVDPEIWNNLSALLARLGDVEEARQTAEKVDKPFAEECSAVVYNRGRLAEIAGQIQEAEQIYHGFKVGDPQHPEAKLRLAIISMDKPGGMNEAERLLKEATKGPITKATAVVYLSKLYGRQKKFKEAQAVLETNRYEGDYLSLAFSSFMHRFLSFLEEERRSRFLTNHIGLPLISMLKRNSHNASAANGVGVYFAEWKMMSEARDAFVAAGSGPHPERIARVNLAHTHVLLGQRELRESAKFTGRPSRRAISNALGLYEQAAKLYSDALEAAKLEGDKEGFTSYCELLLYLAWAQCESRHFQESASTLGRLVHLLPSCGVAWFNLGFSLLEAATERMRSGTMRLDELEAAKNEYEGSRTALQRSLLLLRSHPDSLSRTTVNRREVALLERYVRERGRKHEVKLRNVKDKAEEDEENRRKHLAELQRQQELEKQRERAKEAERIKKEEELRQAFEESQRKQKQFEEQHRQLLERKRKKEDVEDSPWEDEAPAPPPKRGKRRKKEENFVDENSDEETKPQRRRAAVKRKVADGSGSEYSDLPDDVRGDDSESGRGSAPAKRKRMSVSDDDDDDPEAAF